MTSDLSRKNLWLLSVGMDHKLYNKNTNAGALANSIDGWNVWGGSVRYEPFTIQVWDNVIGVYTIDATSGALKVKTCKTDSPADADGGWYTLGGSCAGGPVAAAYDVENKRLAVYVVGMDGNMYSCDYTNNSWNWWKMSISDYRTPAFQPDKIYASSNGQKRVDVVAVGVDNQLYHRYWAGGLWNQWTGIGKNAVGSRPVCVTLNSNRCDIIVRDAHDQKLYHTAIENGIFLGWVKVADQAVVFDPAICVWSSDRIELAAIATNGELLHSFCYNIKSNTLGTWRDGFEKLGGTTKGSPKITCREKDGTTNLDMFVTGMDSGTYYKYWDGGKWNGFFNLGGKVVTKPC